jgi:cytochrome b561
MVLGWGMLAPLAVLIARYFKVIPGQDWPRELDNQTWWRSHWIGHCIVVGLSICAFGLVLPTDFDTMTLHTQFGYAVLLLVLIQVVLGVFRGNKGGPAASKASGTPRGHHYDMTPRRLLFEALHKSLGYGLLTLAAATILLGLWQSNGPIWMWIALLSWWTFLVGVFVVLQKRGMAIDTYQAIWGTDPAHPGNTGKAPGWGVRRMTQGEADVWRDRRDGV